MTRHAVVVGSLFLLLGPAIAESQNTSDVIGNQITVNTKVSASFDNTTGLYTYNYQVMNSSASSEAVESFAVQVNGVIMPDILNPSSPSGWTFAINSDRPILTWDATDVADAPANPSGAPPPSPFQINPGQQLGGFSFQSHSQPGNATYYAQGYVQGPLASPGDIDDEHAVLIPDFTQIGVNGTTTGPVSSATSGPPSVRGFVVVLAPSAASITSAPVQVQVKFAIDGESIDRTTFHAELNGQDVTNAFGQGTGAADLQATFDLSTSPIQAGSNDFIASVSVTDPNSGSATTGASRVTFTIAKTIPGDLNGDGVVNCSDIAIVEASFGKKTGQPEFDSRADVNSDGIVDIRDLAFVSQHLAPGTKCP